MTTLWLWLNSTELNWTLTVRYVDGNCFALCTHQKCASLAHTLSHALLLSAFIWLSQSRSPLSRFLYRTLNSNAGLVSGCIHRQTSILTHSHAHVLTHTYRLVSILLSLPISIRKRARSEALLRSAHSLLVMRVFCLNLSKLWFYLTRSRVCSRSLSLKKTTTLRSNWIRFTFSLCKLDCPENNN